MSNHYQSESFQSKEPLTYENPILQMDIPDLDVIRVGDTYYMSSTTMHMNPGVPIMKSTDLLHWQIVNYVYDILASNDEQELRNGKSEYGKGSWASSLRYHQGIYYLVVGSLATDETYIFQTDDIENGKWKRSVLNRYYHDMSLLFDDDSRVYLVYGSGNIRAIELTEDATAIKERGLNKVIIHNASIVAGVKEGEGLLAEGAHIQKINGFYYIFTITWPKNGHRTQLVHRASVFDGDYEGRIAVNDPTGIAQGGIVDTPNGDWYGMLFCDNGAAGRMPCLVPVTWVDGWPIFGENCRVPKQIPIPVHQQISNNYLVLSDEFNYKSNSLGLVWQWNHNPDNTKWSLTDRPGYLRLITGSICSHLEEAKNTLTQRTFGPECSGSTAVDVSGMKDGDIAGFAAFQKDYGYVGVHVIDNKKLITMVSSSSGSPEIIESVPLDQDRVYFRIDCDFKEKADKAYFYYSLNEKDWNRIGKELGMKYKLDHFMGYRFAVFNFATKEIGGFADFDYFRINDDELN
ncbi:glycoside hydrolase 43 family protein [Niallia sp.]|uniref:glycoside hydrolase family 43 protein n=1 Tax=Niallia sp. TaxID=2837523 RepID=UPI00289F081C|nr:glycoside hydrolase 43 family protein [Niallia sp.]